MQPKTAIIILSVAAIVLLLIFGFVIVYKINNFNTENSNYANNPDSSLVRKNTRATTTEDSENLSPEERLKRAEAEMKKEVKNIETEKKNENGALTDVSSRNLENAVNNYIREKNNLNKTNIKK